MTTPDDQETEDPVNEAPCPELNETLLTLPLFFQDDDFCCMLRFINKTI